MTTTLPYEVLLKIFGELKKPALKKCQLVCKLWRQISAEKLYESFVSNLRPQDTFL